MFPVRSDKTDTEPFLPSPQSLKVPKHPKSLSPPILKQKAKAKEGNAHETPLTARSPRGRASRMEKAAEHSNKSHQAHVPQLCSPCSASCPWDDVVLAGMQAVLALHPLSGEGRPNPALQLVRSAARF